MTCNCNDNYGCGGACDPCSSNTAIKQAVNDALAAEKVTLEGYVTEASNSATEAGDSAAEAGDSAADAASSASAAAQSQANAETAANTATQAATSVTNTAIVLEETAERIEHAQDLLEEQISAIQTKSVYFEVSTPTSSLVLPETETVFNVRSIYVASSRQAVGYGFTFDKETRTVTLAEGITADQIAETEEGYILVEVICDVYSSDDPTSFPLILASNAGASNVGTLAGITVEEALTTFTKVNGLQKIGRATTAAALRAYEPTTSGESVLADINGLDYWYYDDTDTTTPDNGYFCVVTAGGKRWRRNNSKDYIDLNWLGLKPGLDVQPYWQTAIDIIHTAAMAQSSIYNLPYILVTGGNYLLSGTVTTPPYISTVFTKDTKLVADSLVDGTHEAAIVIYCNDAVNLYNNDRSSSFPKTITCSAGKIRLVRAGTRATTNPIGLYTKGATSTAHAINMRISDLEVYGAFLAGHGNTATRTWLMRFDNCQFNGFYGIAYYGTNTDSGERITYSNCVISGGYNDATTKAIYMETSGINIHLLSCSIDFTGGDIIYLTATAKWFNIEVEDSHIESWNGYLVNAESTSDVARFVTFRGTNLLPTGTLGYSQSLSRKLLKGAACKVLFDDCFVSWTVYPYDSYDSILETGSTITVRVRNHKDLALGLHPFTTDNRLLRVYDFTSEAAGNVLTSSTATTTTTTVRKYGTSFANVTASITALDNSLIDTSLAAGTTNTLQLTWGSGGYAYIETVEKVRVTPSRDYGMKATVIMPDLTSKLNLSPAIAWYDENDTLISKTEVYYSDMNAIVNQSITGAAAYLSRANKRVACRTSSVKAPAGAAYARGVMQLTNGTTGSVYYLTDYNLFISPTN